MGWVAIGLMTALAVAFVVRPLLARALPSRQEKGGAVYRAQLREIARERESGALSAADAEAAEAEIGRRLIAAASETVLEKRSAPPRAAWAAATAFVMAAAAIVLYALLGVPGMPDFPLAARKAEQRPALAGFNAEDQARIRAMVETLAARLESEPNDVEGWLRLGRSYGVLGEAEKSAAAYGRAAALAPKEVPILLAYGQALLAARPGPPFGTDFLDLMARVQALEPEHPVPLLFLGIEAAQAGRKDDAEKLWARLLSKLPEGSPERAEVEKRIAQYRMN